MQIPANDNQQIGFAQWLHGRVGGRWYTAKSPRRTIMQDRVYLSPKRYKALEAEYVRVTGRDLA